MKMLRIALTLLLVAGCAAQTKLVNPECPPDEITLPAFDVECMCSDRVYAMSEEQSHVFVEWVAGWQACAVERGIVIDTANEGR